MSNHFCKWCLNNFKVEDMETLNQCKACFNNPFRTKEKKITTSKIFSFLETKILDEVLACLHDSDRYIDEQLKLSLIDIIEIELKNRIPFPYYEVQYS